MRFALILAAGLILAGCTGPNTDIRNIQLSGAENDLPVDYRDRAARAVAGLPLADGAKISFSEPRTIVGATAFAPKRWYVCARGIQSPGPKPVGKKPLLQIADEMLLGATPRGRYDVVVIFDQAGLTSLWKGYDAGLCET